MFFPFRRPKRKTNAFHTNRIIHDTFTGNDGVRISQRLTDSGHTWVDSSGTMECYGGKARIKTAATPNRARIPTNQSEVTVKCRLTVTATKGAGVCPRYLDSSNYIGAVVMSNQMLLFKVVTGTMTALYDQPHAWTNDDQLAVVCKADKVSIYHNERLVTTKTVTEFQSSTGQSQCMITPDGGDAALRWDNFEVLI